MPAASADRGEVRYSSFVGAARARVAARGLRDNETPSGVRYSVVKSELRVGFGEIWRNRSGTRQGFGLDGETEAVHSDEPFSARKEHWLELEMEWLTDSN